MILETQDKQLPFDEIAMQEVREKRLLIDQFDTWLYEEYAPFVGNRILEVGCGMGNQLVHFCDRELAIGIDISRGCIEQVKKKFCQYKNLEFYCMNILESESLTLGEKNIDTVVSLNVFEHLPDDNIALQHVRELLNPGGKLILIVPAHEGLYGSMDIPMSHYRRYTKQTAEAKLAQAGFNVITQKYINMLGGIGWLVNGRILQRRVAPSGQLKLLNKIIPYLRWLEGRINAPFGISLLTVAEKSA
jgi:2-polyprenyl-3-methyl-5-hydroxy-6-metoxy-1,4-benzoquinol methylase